MFKKIIKSEIMLLIPMLIVVGIWQYYVGYILASIFITFAIFSLLTFSTKRAGDNGAITALAIGAIPISIIILLSIWANQSETGKLIETGVIVLIIISGVFDSIGKIKDEIKREKMWEDGTALKKFEELINKRRQEKNKNDSTKSNNNSS